ncbi:dihydrofolate reductase [Planosporangium thailandense]|uniref:Dihydrofolate reductase n=1 Tax=Planosporangium thailandense TaxID=765197 RepID=A0ABX0Y7W6_9ACTN|nr:dihydrofolate reductase family protein [Planosporangium thailandense]NJC73497.1 dihydrofolate reductase [Planosporangium thailandense]
MGNVVVGLAVSVDGYIAGPEDGPTAPLGEGGAALFEWYTDGDTPSRHHPRFRMARQSAAVFDAIVDPVGAVVTGRRTYDITGGWGGDSPVPGRPLFILTHHVPRPLPETTVPHTFVTDGVASAIAQARAAAGDRDVSLAGAQAVQQAIRAGLLDELHLAVVPVLLGGGVRLFDHLGGPVRLEKIRVVDAPSVTHLSYRVREDSRVRKDA